MKRTTVRMAVLVAVLAFAGLAQAELTAHLTGDQAVPPSGSSATGDATLRPNRDNTELRYKVTVTGLYNDGSTEIHLYLGDAMAPSRPDQSVATLPVTTTKKGRFTGVLSSGALTAAGLTGPLAGHPLADLVGVMAQGKVFIEIATAADPTGELRGTIN